ncbi:hypothetical protein FJY69_10060 [candidate division WOR-3 bacterium]|nr:hypothetical protein [candidate division WOR-3 bacterium]
MIVRLKALLPAALCLGLGACHLKEGNPELNPNYREPMVNGWVYKTEFWDGSIDYDKNVEVIDNVGLRMVPVVTLNGRPLEVYYYGTTSFRYGDEEYNPVREKYELNVRHYWGEAFSRVVLPGDFRITGPQPRSVLARESTLVATWQSSFAAQWYWVGIYCDYDFYDTLGEWDDHTFQLDTLVFDTMLTVNPARIFPGYVDSVIEGDGSVMVWAGNGPSIEPGDVGNVRGSGFGFFHAINEPRENYFYVVAPPLSRRCTSQPAARDQFYALLLARARAR